MLERVYFHHIHIKYRAWSLPSLPSTSLHHVFYINFKIEDGRQKKQDGIHSQGPTPPTVFSVPNRNKKLEVRRREGERGGENVSLKTHATTFYPPGGRRPPALPQELEVGARSLSYSPFRVLVF